MQEPHGSNKAIYLVGIVGAIIIQRCVAALAIDGEFVALAYGGFTTDCSDYGRLLPISRRHREAWVLRPQGLVVGGWGEG